MIAAIAVLAAALLPNVSSSLTVWGDFRQAKYPGFLEYAILFTSTGGSAERDLFADPADESRLDDYDFTHLLTNCRNVLASGLKPNLHLGNVPVKFTKGCDPRRIKAGGKDGGSFGFNVRPPDDYAVYAAYMKAIAEALVGAFGRDEVRIWRFSVLTEANNRHWFEARDGTKKSTREAFFRLYDCTVKAFTDVLGGDIVIGTHLLGSDNDAEMMMFDHRDVIDHCKRTGMPLRLLAFSYYCDHPDDDGDNPAAGRLTDFAKFRKALDAAGFSDTIVAMEEGRVYGTKNEGTGRWREQLPTRAVGQSWQAAFDVRAAKSAFDAGGSYVASWGHLSGANAAYEGLPTVSFLTARELAKFAGMRPYRAEIVADVVSPKDQVDVIAAVDAAGRTVRLATCRFRDRLTFSDELTAKVRVALPEAMRGKTVQLSVLTVDDRNNWFTDWIADRKAAGIGRERYSGSLDEQAPPMSLSDAAAQRLFAEKSRTAYAAKAAKVGPIPSDLAVPPDGVVEIPVSLVGNVAVFLAMRLRQEDSGGRTVMVGGAVVAWRCEMR